MLVEGRFERELFTDGSEIGSTRAMIYVDGELLDPEPSQEIRNHSPDGFQWGFGGSGPAQLALALLLHHTQDPDKAQRYYQTFKWDVVARWPNGQPFTMSLDIDAWLIAQIQFEALRYSNLRED